MADPRNDDAHSQGDSVRKEVCDPGIVADDCRLRELPSSSHPEYEGSSENASPRTGSDESKQVKKCHARHMRPLRQRKKEGVEREIECYHEGFATLWGSGSPPDAGRAKGCEGNYTKAQ